MTNPKHIELLEQSKAHYEADMLIKGTYGEFDEEFKGCSVGCHVHHIRTDASPNEIQNVHAVVADYYEYPEWLVRLQDTIFEGLPDGENRKWHVQLAQAIHDNPTVDWQACLHRVHIGILRISYATAGEAGEVVQAVLHLHERSLAGDAISSAEWSAAWSAAESAAWSAAESAARSAARSAAESAESAARSAAWSAAESAWSAAWSAAYQEIRDLTLKAIEESAA